MKKLLCFTLLLSAFTAVGQNQNIDSLKSVLAQSYGKAKIKALLELCWEYRFINADSARNFGLTALDLARKASIRDYEVEALHNIGVTHEAQGNYSEALTFELEALALRQGTILHRYMVTYNSLKLIGFPKLLASACFYHRQMIFCSYRKSI